MILRKRIAIIVEEQTALEITWHYSGALAWCQECGEQVSNISLEKGAQTLAVSPGEIDRLIHRKAIHCVNPTAGRLAICVKSIITGISSWVNDNDLGEC